MITTPLQNTLQNRNRLSANKVFGCQLPTLDWVVNPSLERDGA